MRMPSPRRISCLAAACVAIAGAARSVRADAPAATQPARSPESLVAAYQSAIPPLQTALNGHDFAIAAERKAVSGDAVPALRKMIATLAEMETAMPTQAVKIRDQKEMYEGFLYALDDEPTLARTDSLAKNLESPDGRSARAVQLRSQWAKTADKDAAGRAAVIDALQKLDLAHPEDEQLTFTTFALYQQAVDPTQKAQLQALVTDTMKNRTSARFANYFKSLAARQEQAKVAGDKLKAMVAQPLTIAGTTVDGKTFSTDQWKGKVVLVDFWATWCAPCKAELPRVKNAYAQYHDKGLEVIGISNDYSPAPLTAFIAANGMPWPELFDAAAAEDQQWNSITVGYGIDSIPQMFLIDKKGVLRTVEARQSFEELIPKLLAE